MIQRIEFPMSNIVRSSICILPILARLTRMARAAWPGRLNWAHSRAFGKLPPPPAEADHGRNYHLNKAVNSRERSQRSQRKGVLTDCVITRHVNCKMRSHIAQHFDFAFFVFFCGHFNCRFSVSVSGECWGQCLFCFPSFAISGPVAFKVQGSRFKVQRFKVQGSGLQAKSVKF